MMSFIPQNIPGGRGGGLDSSGSLLPPLGSEKYLGLTESGINNISLRLNNLTNIPKTSLKQRNVRALVESVPKNDCDHLNVTREWYKEKSPKELAAIQQALSRQGEFFTTGEANEKGEYTVAPDLWEAIGCFVESELVAHLRDKQTGEGFYLAAKGLSALLDVCHADTKLHDAVLQLCCYYLTMTRNIAPHHPGATSLLIKLSPNTVDPDDKKAFFATSHCKYYKGIDAFRAGNFSKASKLLTKFCREQQKVVPTDSKRVEKATAIILKAEAKILTWDEEVLLQEDGSGDRTYTTIIENLRKGTLSMSERINRLLQRIEKFWHSVKNFPESRYMRGIAIFLQSYFSNNQETKTEKLHTAAGLGNPDAILSLRFDQAKEKAQQCALHHKSFPKGDSNNRLNLELENILNYSRGAGLNAEQILSVVDIIKTSGGEPANNGWSETCLKQAFKQYIFLSFSDHPQPSLSDSEGSNEESLRVGWKKWERDSWLVKLWEVGKKNGWLPESESSPISIQMPLLDKQATVSNMSAKSIGYVYDFLSQKGMSALRPEELFTAIKQENFEDYNFTNVGNKGRTIFHHICADPSMARWALGPVMKVAKSMNVPVQHCLSTLDNSGHTPLTIAITLRDIRSVRAMIHKGAFLSTVYQPGINVACTTKYSLPVCNPLFVAYHAGHRMMDLVLSCILDEALTGNYRQLRSLDIWTALRKAKLSDLVEKEIGNQAIITHHESMFPVWENINTKLQHLAETAKAGIYTGQRRMMSLHLSLFPSKEFHNKDISESMASLTQLPDTRSFGSVYSLNRDAQLSLGKANSLTTLQQNIIPRSSIGRGISLTTLDKLKPHPLTPFTKLPSPTLATPKLGGATTENVEVLDESTTPTEYHHPHETLTTLDKLKPHPPTPFTKLPSPTFGRQTRATPKLGSATTESVEVLDESTTLTAYHHPHETLTVSSPPTFERKASAPPELRHTTTSDSASLPTWERKASAPSKLEHTTTESSTHKLKSKETLETISTPEEVEIEVEIADENATLTASQKNLPYALTEITSSKSKDSLISIDILKGEPHKRDLTPPLRKTSAPFASDATEFSSTKIESGYQTLPTRKNPTLTTNLSEVHHAPVKKTSKNDQTNQISTEVLSDIPTVSLPKPIHHSTQQGVDTGDSAETQKITPPIYKGKGLAAQTPPPALQPEKTPDTGGASTPDKAGKKGAAQTPSTSSLLKSKKTPGTEKASTPDKARKKDAATSKPPFLIRPIHSTQQGEDILATADILKVVEELDHICKATRGRDKRMHVINIQKCIKTQTQYMCFISCHRELQPALEKIIPFVSLPKN